MKIVYVNGENDFSAMDMLDSGELVTTVKQMLSDNQHTVESEDGSVVSILEVGEVDNRFIKFVRNTIVDYDLSKQSDFYLLDELLEV